MLITQNDGIEMKMVAWVGGNLAWTALMYGVTRAYSRLKRLPENPRVTAIGTIVAAASGLIAATWFATTTRIPASSLSFYLYLAGTATWAPALLSIVFMFIGPPIFKLDPMDSPFEQFLEPFYICMGASLLWVGLLMILMVFSPPLTFFACPTTQPDCRAKPLIRLHILGSIPWRVVGS